MEKGQRNNKARFTEKLRRLSADYLREVMVLEEALVFAQTAETTGKKRSESKPVREIDLTE